MLVKLDVVPGGRFGEYEGPGMKEDPTDEDEELGGPGTDGFFTDIDKP